MTPMPKTSRAPLQESRRVAGVQAPVIPIVGELTKAHPGTISLGQGVVSYGPPPQALDQIQNFLTNADNHKYKLVQGIPELLERIESKLRDENDVSVNAQDQVVVTAGSNMGFQNTVLAIADPGDEIILPAPYYFNHEMAITQSNCVPRIVPTDSNHQLDLDALAANITPKTRAIVTISPNNPSGAVYSREALTAVNHLCRDRGLYHISDEAYEYFTYDGAEHFSPASLPDATPHTISLYSLSKAYGFASWRIGYMVIPPALLNPIKKIQDTILICPPVVSQFAACGALDAGPAFWKPQLEALAESRQMVQDALTQLSPLATFAPAKGAFYFLVRLRDPADPMDVIRHLVTQHQVAAIPGSAFGYSDACYLRIAYAAIPKEPLREGIARFAEGLKSFRSPTGRNEH